MALENGLEKLSRARKHIDRLRDRRLYLLDKIENLEAVGKDMSNGFERGEAEAIAWALPILEAEWDNLRRMRIQVDRIENRLGTAERYGVDPKSVPDWQAS